MVVSEETVRLLGGLLRLVLGDTAPGAADLLLPVLGLLDLLAGGLLLVLKEKKTRKNTHATNGNKIAQEADQ